VINCENCHGPDDIPVIKSEDKTGTKTITTDRSQSLCLRCHLSLPARPGTLSTFPQPQIVLKKHMKGKGNLACFKCHNPHHPDLKPPEPVKTPADSNVNGTSTTTKDEKKTVSAKGRSIYNDKCLVCHGAKGDGKTEVAENLDPKPPDFARLKIGLSQLVGFIANGKGEQMPAYKDELSGEEIKEAAGYVEGFKK